MDAAGKQPVQYADGEIRNLLLGLGKKGIQRAVLTDAMYTTAIQRLQTCPTAGDRLFINTTEGNCWMDSAMIGITFCDDLGKTMRAVLIAYLRNCKRNKYTSPDQLLEYIGKWKTSNSWRTYIIRMMLLLLLGSEKAIEWLSCPLVAAGVQKLQWQTLFDFKDQDIDVMKDIRLAGGYPLHAAIRFLIPMFHENVIVKHLYVAVGTKTIVEHRLFDMNQSKEEVLRKQLSSYMHRLTLYSLQRKDPGKTGGHAICSFACEGKVYLYDDNTGLYDVPGSVLPRHIILQEVAKVGTTYTLQCGSATIVLKSKPLKHVESRTYSLLHMYEVWTHDIYKTMKEAPKKFKIGTAHPTPQQFTPLETLEEELKRIILSRHKEVLVSVKDLLRRGANPSAGILPSQQVMADQVTEYLVKAGGTYDTEVMKEFAKKTGNKYLLGLFKPVKR
jgi:hypothetical protein